MWKYTLPGQRSSSLPSGCPARSSSIEHTIVQVVPRLPGIVLAVYRHHGQQVKKGDVLAVIESQMLAELRSQYLVAKKRLGWRKPPSIGKSGYGKRRSPPSRIISPPSSALNEAEIAVDLAAVKLRSLGVRPESPFPEGSGPLRNSCSDRRAHHCQGYSTGPDDQGGRPYLYHCRHVNGLGSNHGLSERSGRCSRSGKRRP